MKLQSALILLSASVLAGCGGGSGGNTAPIFEQPTYQFQATEDQTATFNVVATDANNDTLTYSLANAPVNAAVNVNTSSGAISFTPNTNFNGDDSFAVNVTDGEDTASVTINVTVAPVNDAPEYANTEVIVAGGEVKKGLIEATDVDGDTLTYQVTSTTQNGVLDIDAQSGEVTYTPTELVDVNDSFTVLISDGNGGELSKELTIRASLATNADRAYHYYASEQSHLKQAESLITSLSNDLNQGLVFNELAAGYAEAGLTREVERLVTPEQIVRDEIRARTLLDVSFIYNALSLEDQAQAYRAEANTLYSAYVASKGTAGFDSDDASFYTALAASYNAAGQADQASEAFGILDTLFNNSLDGDSTTAALRTFFSYRNLVEEAIEDWQVSRAQADYDLAHSMTARLYSYANLISHRFVSNDRNGNEGKPYHSVRQVALMDVITSYMSLNDFDNAKEALHDIFALHGVVGIDDDYPRTADPYFEVTKVEYEFGLYGVIEEFVVLYPDATLDAYLTGFPPGSFWALFAEDDAADARLMAQVRNMDDKDAALDLVIAAKEDDDLRGHFTNLVAFNSSNPGGAIFLRQQGHYEAAGKFLTEATNLLATPEYISENLNTEPFVTGTTGCMMVLEELAEIYRLTGEEAYKTQAQATVDSCITIAQTHYSNGTDGTDVEISDAIIANTRPLLVADWLDIADEKEALLATIETNFAKIDAADYEEKMDHLQSIAIALASGDSFTQAQEYYTRAFAQLNLLEENGLLEEFGQETQEFFSDSRSSGSYVNFLALIESNAGTMDDYVQIRDTAYTAWNDLIELRLEKLADEGNQVKLNFLPGYANQYIRLGEFDKALALSNDEALGVVETESIITQVASGLSVRDHFKQTLLATVDTDGDGKANFFIESATQEQIAQSGITLDEDSDNDGVIDEEDAFPLDATKQ